MNQSVLIYGTFGLRVSSPSLKGRNMSFSTSSGLTTVGILAGSDYFM